MKDNSEMTKEELIALGWVKNPLDKMQEKTEKKLTAVEYIREKLLGDQYWYEDMTFDQIIDKAKEMEKEHLYNFYMQGGVDAITEAYRNVEQYYNEIFNKK